MISILALATSAWGQTALVHYCSDGWPRPPQADDACRCMRALPATAHTTTDTANPDWYGDVTAPDRLTPPPEVQLESCFNVTGVTSLLGSWPVMQGELRDVLGIKAEKLAHEHGDFGGTYDHHWEGNQLADASMHMGCGEEYLTFFDYTGLGSWEADLKDYQGNRILGFDTLGQGNIVGMESRNAAAWATSPVFVVLDTGAVFVLPPPHNGQGNWHP